jgi:hypothetical protein
MGKTKELPAYPKGITFEQVWAALMEDRERQKETERIMKENSRETRENLERTAREMKENLERTIERTTRKMDKRAKQLDKQLGKLGGRFGEMVEYMVVPNLIKKFRKLGFVFDKAYQQAKIEDENNRTIAEVDITLENGDKVMIVEVKSKPTTEDITDHVRRMGKIRAHADSKNDQRKFLGAVAGMVFNDNEKEFAMKNGFYVIEPSGETFIITPPEGEYSPREW